MDLQKEIEHLFVSQQKGWDLMSSAIEQLDKVQTKSFYWGNEILVQLQYNPARIISASTKTEENEINSRPCFLCTRNRPPEQTGISFLEKYVILTNPYPILRNHLTVASQSHVPQRIRNRVGDVLSLVELLPDYVVFYNGPNCGASAPDHFHLQAGLKTKPLLSGDNELRSCFVIESDSAREVTESFEDIYYFLRNKQANQEEPMLNIIAFAENNRYVLHVFPRKSHRPRQYFYEGKQKLLISPGALDMAGLIIASREEDFIKITKEDVEDIFSQVSMQIM